MSKIKPGHESDMDNPYNRVQHKNTGINMSVAKFYHS